MQQITSKNEIIKVWFWVPKEFIIPSSQFYTCLRCNNKNILRPIFKKQNIGASQKSFIYPLVKDESWKLVGVKLSLSPPLQLPMMFLAMSLGPTPLEVHPHQGSIPCHTALTPLLGQLQFLALIIPWVASPFPMASWFFPYHVTNFLYSIWFNMQSVLLSGSSLIYTLSTSRSSKVGIMCSTSA